MIPPDLEAKIAQLRLVVFDFDGVFTDNMVYVAQDGTEMVRCTRADGLGLQKLRDLGIEARILSTEVNPVVTARAAKLKIECDQGCPDKGLAMSDLMEEKGLAPQQVAFVGNDINDAEALQLVGVPIVVADAHPDVMPYALYVTKAAGGHGAVREVCDIVADIKAKVIL